LMAFSKLAFPDLPVKLDGIFWNVGHEWCHETNPNCQGCPLKEICMLGNSSYNGDSEHTTTLHSSIISFMNSNERVKRANKRGFAATLGLYLHRITLSDSIHG
jgi:adenine-specific DNA glycosylase